MKLISNLEFLNILRKMNPHIENTLRTSSPPLRGSREKKPILKFYILFVPKLKYPSSNYACRSWPEQRFNLRRRYPCKQKANQLENKTWYQASFTQCATAHAGFQYMKKLVNCKIFSNQLRILWQWSIRVTLKFLDGTFQT